MDIYTFLMHLIFQIINFAKLKDLDEFNFPAIDTGESVFKRSYKRRTDNRLDFRISIENKKDGKIISEHTPLLMLLRENLLDMLHKSGFSDIKIYTNYERTPADGTEFASIYSAVVS